MPVGIGYKGLGSYEPEYFKLPFNELLAGLSAKQDKFDKNQVSTDNLSKLFGEAGIRTQDKLEAVKAKYQPEINRLTEQLYTTGNVNPYEIQKLATSITNDPDKKIYDYDFKIRDKVLETQASQEFPEGYMAGFDKKNQSWTPYTGSDLSGLAEGYRLIKPADWNKEYQTDLGSSIKEKIKEIDPTFSVQEIQNPDTGESTYKILKKSGEEITWDRDLATQLLLKPTPSGRTLLDQLWETKNKPGKQFRGFQYEDLAGQGYDKEAFFNDLLDSSEGLFYNRQKLNFSDSGIKSDGSGSGKKKKNPFISLGASSDISYGEKEHILNNLDLKDYTEQELFTKINEAKEYYSIAKEQAIENIETKFPQFAGVVAEDPNTGKLRLSVPENLFGDEVYEVNNYITDYNASLAADQSKIDLLSTLRLELLEGVGLDINFEKSEDYQNVLNRNAQNLTTKLGDPKVWTNVTSKIPQEELTKKPGEKGYGQEVKEYVLNNPDKFVRDTSVKEYNALDKTRVDKEKEFQSKLKQLATTQAMYRGKVYTLNPAGQPDEPSKAKVKGLKTSVLSQFQANPQAARYLEDETLVSDGDKNDFEFIQKFLNNFNRGEDLADAIVQIGFDEGDGRIRALVIPSSYTDEKGNKNFRSSTKSVSPIEIDLSEDIIKEIMTTEEFNDNYLYGLQSQMSNSLNQNKGITGVIETGLNNKLTSTVDMSKLSETGRTFQNSLRFGNNNIRFKSNSPSQATSFLTDLEREYSIGDKILAQQPNANKEQLADLIINETASKHNIGLVPMEREKLKKELISKLNFQ
jgi:hypothetical protein